MRTEEVLGDGSTGVSFRTDYDGRIRDATPEAARLLNISPRLLSPRPAAPFFQKDRPALMRMLDDAARGHQGEMRTVVRPREKRPQPVVIRMEQDPLDIHLVRWTLILEGAETSRHPRTTPAI